MSRLVAPDGTTIIGTLESIPGVARIGNVRTDGAGRHTFDYIGETDVRWNEQETVSRDGQPVMVDASGAEWPLNKCTVEVSDDSDEDGDDDDEDHRTTEQARASP
ncbi:hypothetical protein [uncultured Hyphomicrobium sp.]|uniref:hypothetical protein n=1 Tax=uncultured Hyphomicrobium sp. TaxID=194373 RepID=UPI0025FFA58F|nr:hypothetical protein [uncultured Hyphomicrobium sp.]